MADYPKVSLDELLKVKDYIRSISGSLFEGLILLDGQGKIISVNEGAQEILGFREDEIITRSLTEILSKDDIPSAQEVLASVLKKTNIEDLHLRCLAKDQEKIPVVFRTLAIKDKDDKIGFIICLLKDERTGEETEQIFRRAFDRLKEKNQQLTQVEKIEIVKKLALGVAHEVKNPLAIILQCVDYLTKKIKTDDENISLSLTHIREAVRRIDSLSIGLLNLCRLTDLSMIRCNINLIVEKALSLMKDQFDKQNIQVTRSLDEKISSLTIDKDKIEQVFVNLFANSLAAMPKGGELCVKSYMLRPQGKPKRVILEIEDTGSGIPENILSKVFDPFFSTHHQAGCAGLGLAVIRNIIELHNAKISIQNKEDIGVRVTLTFKSS